METKSKEDCIKLAIDSLYKLQDISTDVVGLLEKSKAFVPDESKTVQDLRRTLALSQARETKLLRVDDELDALTELNRELKKALALSENNRDGLKKSLAKSIERETELESRLAASFARERRLTSYIGSLCNVAAEAESILEDVKDIGRILPTEGNWDVGPAGPALHHPSPHLDQEKFKHTGIFPVAEEDKARQGLNNPVEACCQNYEECDKQCVPLANYWRNRAKEAEKKVKAYQWHMQWTIPDVTCNTEPAKPAEQQTGAKFPPWYNANSEFKA